MTEVNEPRRRFLIGATSFVAGAGVVGVATPFVQSWNPSAKAKAVGAPVQVDISKIDPGAMITVAWQGKPVWVVRRTAENLKNLALEEHREELRDPDSEVNQQPEYAKNSYRSIKEEYFVAVGICTHLGCVPNYEPDGRAEVKHALFFCPCHGSKFDLAGRVFTGVPAPTNLIIPPHQYLGNNVLEIGSDATTS
ncbi:MAG: ubiquinol-cytochrome c reductase iron-sulfur subunit [Porticoccus sp.]|uniref:ubiquinol-cytochrome c reductase iron-sulfur subunit n=1 Tax=Porticoccus hydrocarbonoclasticus TaxID=1073414 RepID=UPI000C501351|nr:ubiquinol-cytochrome c reductase iron-sulfur subunit [Porticoccus hydrocarbonoclasticus]MBG58480.1 ubiquinol-cytochrome c reductase iron-sulfur subunit [Porticoccus sp.]|tara:strand:+ start:1557 stop:2138 length:582 start_codon:yes stop_codon:yes gene_type:complete